MDLKSTITGSTTGIMITTATGVMTTTTLMPGSTAVVIEIGIVVSMKEGMAIH